MEANQAVDELAVVKEKIAETERKLAAAEERGDTSLIQTYGNLLSDYLKEKNRLETQGNCNSFPITPVHLTFAALKSFLHLTPHLSITFAAFRFVGQGGGGGEGQGELWCHGVVRCC